MSWSPCPDPVPGDRVSADAIEMLIIPRAVDLGEMQVRRALPSAKRQMVGPFIFFDQMGPAQFLTDQGIDVRPHPHINLATVTYLFEGQILHRDSLGTEKTIEPGAVNWMQAGRGIVHSERTSPERRRTGQRLFGIQTWMALPEEQEESDPAFVHHSSDELPTVATDSISAGTRFGCAQRPTPNSCSSAGPRWEGRVTSGGTSSHPGQSASSKRRRSGPAVGSTRCQVTWRSSSLCPKHRRSLGALQARFSTLSRPPVVRLSATSQLALLQHHRVRHARRYSPPSAIRSRTSSSFSAR